MKKIDEFFSIVGWNERLNKIVHKPEEKKPGKSKIALVFFIAGLLSGIIMMEYVIPWILIYI
ncbi:MAG: hypothetical protein ACQEQM_06375 [Thermoplasmatota archaeon]